MFYTTKVPQKPLCSGQYQTNIKTPKTQFSSDFKLLTQLKLSSCPACRVPFLSMIKNKMSSGCPSSPPCICPYFSFTWHYSTDSDAASMPMAVMMAWGHNLLREKVGLWSGGKMDIGYPSNLVSILYFTSSPLPWWSLSHCPKATQEP